jgi:hypothetical protein
MREIEAGPNDRRKTEGLEGLFGIQDAVVMLQGELRDAGYLDLEVDVLQYQGLKGAMYCIFAFGISAACICNIGQGVRMPASTIRVAPAARLRV